MAQQAFSLIGRDAFISVDDENPDRAMMATVPPSEIPKMIGLDGQPQGAWNAVTANYKRGDVVTHNFALYQLTGVAIGAFATVGESPDQNTTQWTLVASLGGAPEDTGFDKEDF